MRSSVLVEKPRSTLTAWENYSNIGKNVEQRISLDVSEAQISQSSSFLRSQQLNEKHGHLTHDERLARIDKLSKENYMRRLSDMINEKEYVYRYLSEESLRKTMETGNIRGYSTTVFSHSSNQVSSNAQILPEWGVPTYGAAIPTNNLNGFQLARPFGNRGDRGWEIFAHSYPKAGPGGWSQFLIDPISIENVYIYRLKP